MDLLEQMSVLSSHRNRLAGEPLDAFGGRSPASQMRRFEALCRWGDLSGNVVLDLGCGYGDLKPFLDARFQDFVYLGVDLLPDFIEKAKADYHHLPDTHFLVADFVNDRLPQVDVVIASGSLNYRSANSLHPWQTISRMWTAADPAGFPGA